MHSNEVMWQFPTIYKAYHSAWQLVVLNKYIWNKEQYALVIATEWKKST